MDFMENWTFDQSKNDESDDDDENDAVEHRQPVIKLRYIYQLESQIWLKI